VNLDTAKTRDFDGRAVISTAQIPGNRSKYLGNICGTQKKDMPFGMQKKGVPGCPSGVAGRAAFEPLPHSGQT
jgi:hypothetical protein